MIDVKDLRLGSYLTLVAHHPEETIRATGQVTGILKDKVIMGGTDLLEGIPTPFKNLEPIPLTEEWLLKAGFEKADQPGDEDLEAPYFSRENLMVGLLPQGVLVCLMADVVDTEGVLASQATCELIFPNGYAVHQLQNLTHALTGTELTFSK